MKKTLLLAVVAVCSMTANAQIASGRSTSFFSTEKSENPISFGIRAGINLNHFVADDAETDAQVGFRLGVVADIPIFESLHFEPGLYFSTRPCKSSGSERDYDGDIYKWETKYNPSYLELPLLLSYRYNFSEDWGWRVNLGPYLAYGLGGKAKWDDGDKEKLFGEQKYGNNKYTNLKRLDIGLMFGTSVTYKNFLLEVGYQVGLTNINKDLFWDQNDNRASVKNSGVYIQLGYNF